MACSPLTLPRIIAHRLAPLALLLALPAGCTVLGTGNDPGTIEYYASLRYPESSDVAASPDIVATPDDGELTLHNRTDRRFPMMQLWINRQYVAEVPPTEVGNNPPLRLTRFVNQHEEPFPIAALLAPDRARPVLLAELYDPRSNTRYKLTVEPENP